MNWSFLVISLWNEEKCMTLKASKFADAKEVFILRLCADSVPVTVICWLAGIGLPQQKVSIQIDPNIHWQRVALYNQFWSRSCML
ncbi:MAG: hypothetical protein CFE32_18485 [Alphaproteobacteria bacterium PA3]|nr:MAG: hypothetical protein CFE32_18485 [Alphaproteobacteria bacterium PA3]